jgi:hypothetical protein
MRDEPICGWNCIAGLGCSPRMRGWTADATEAAYAAEVFPTRAGMAKQVENRTRYFVPGLPLLKILLFIPLLT